MFLTPWGTEIPLGADMRCGSCERECAGCCPGLHGTCASPSPVLLFRSLGMSLEKTICSLVSGPGVFMLKMQPLEVVAVLWFGSPPQYLGLCGCPPGHIAPSQAQCGPLPGLALGPGSCFQLWSDMAEPDKHCAFLKGLTETQGMCQSST